MQTVQALQEVRFSTSSKHLQKSGSLSCLFTFFYFSICSDFFDGNKHGLFFMPACVNEGSYSNISIISL